jgi:nucleoside-diphosphate-sugar epimerase
MSTNSKNRNEKKILIVGGSGFIGRNSIIKFTEYHIGKMINMDKEISGLGIKTIYIDLKFPILSEIRKFAPDYIIYLASLNETESDDFDLAYKINVTGLEYILQELIDYENLKKFIYVSDYKLYTDPLPFTEHSDIQTNNNYLKTKYEAEKVCTKYINQFGFPIIIFRASSIYGPYDRKNSDIISSYIKSAYTNKYIEILNNNIYDYLYITDFIRAIILSFDTLYTGVINIGSGQGFENINIARYIAFKLNISYAVKNNTVYEIHVNDITNIKNVLSWSPEISISKGIDKTMTYFKSSL